MKEQFLKTAFRFTFFFVFLAFVTDMRSQTITNTYTYDASNFLNPDRGFVDGGGGISYSNFFPLDLNTLLATKNSEKSSLIGRLYYLDSFMNGPINAAYLNDIANDFTIMRQAGVKCMLRFAYSWLNNPPNRDVPKALMLTHIAQLKPILSANMDVIVVLQAGFIGSWGEWAFTDNFNGPNSTADRKEVTDSLINVFGKKRFVQIRTPMFKTDMLGITYNDTLSYADAFGTTDQALMAYHNDCFLATSNDAGTYSDTTIQKPFTAYENRYLPIGGELCINDQTYCNCTTAQKEMRRMHWTMLSRDRSLGISDDWVNQGCFDDIQKKLGYRLVLINSFYNDQIIQGNQISIQLKIFNEGYASVMNKKNVEFIFKNTSSQTEYSILDSQIDPRHWKAGDSTLLNINYGIGNNLPDGSYKLYLKLGDEEPSINTNSDYAIRFSNQNVWDPATGYNELGTVNINSNGNPGTPYTGTQWFGTSTTGVQPITSQQSGYMNLFPNPVRMDSYGANDGTTVLFYLSKKQSCEISVADMLGQKIYHTVIVANEKYNELFIPLDDERFLSGIYFISVKGNDFIQTKRLAILKK